MSKAFDIIDSNVKTLYTFRFGTSDKIVHLTQEQVDRIRYLSTRVIHKDVFSSIQNENDEYVLNPPIDYIRFKAILHSITLKQPYRLFNELPEDENIMDTFQLFDYLGVSSFPLPLLKDVILTRSNPTNNYNKKRHVKYHRASQSEIRNKGAEFIIALSKNEYDLNDLQTLEDVFSLIMVIFSNRFIYKSRFLHHTLTVVKECCFGLFSLEQQRQLSTSQQIFHNSHIDSLRSLYDDDQPSFGDSGNISDWRGISKPIEKNHTAIVVQLSAKLSLLIKTYYSLLSLHSSENKFNPNWLDALWTRVLSMAENSNDKQCYISEGDSARSGRFNTLPKRPNVDKFKHRSGPKAQKHR